MPLYEYVCHDCGSRVEIMRRMSDRANSPPCEACGSSNTGLTLSPSAFLGGSAGGACSTSAWTGGG